MPSRVASGRTFEAPRLSPDDRDRDKALVLATLTSKPKTMSELAEVANQLAVDLGFPPYGEAAREKRNRGERTKFEYLRYRSYYDYFRLNCAPAEVVAIDKAADPNTFALGPNAAAIDEIRRAVRALRRIDEPNGDDETKDARLNIRLSEHEKQVITRAAELLNTTVSAFVLRTAYEQAQATIGEQTEFRLPEDKWREFCAALDAPPKEIPQLRELLTNPSIFDE